MSIIFSSEGYITPIDKVQSDLHTFEELFVKNFANSVTRPRLWENYLAYLDNFRQKVTPNFVQWLDGSFVTLKENPNDIDLVTFIDYKIFEPMEEQKRLEEFWSFNLEDKGLDSYLLGVYPEGHPEYPVYEYNMRNWHIRYTNAKTSKKPIENVKGYIEIIFKI